MELARFIAFVVKLAIALALIGQLKSCTLVMLGLASAKTETGITSYSKYTHSLFSK